MTADKIMALAETHYQAGNTGDGLPRLSQEEAAWLIEQLLEEE